MSKSKAKKRTKESKNIQKPEVPKDRVTCHNPQTLGVLKVLPLYLDFCLKANETRHAFNEMTGVFQWSDSEVTAMPTVMIVGRAGIGKTTLLHNLFKEAYVGSSRDIKTPTAAFNIIVQGEKNQVITITKAMIAGDLNYVHLKRVSSETLDRIKLVHTTHQLSNYITFIDCPGYTADLEEYAKTYGEALSYFSNRADLLIMVAEDKDEQAIQI
uniref:G domain-containing protein n=1 Tax=Rhabditophanes sp. KR3021 TaxID=114890 RepID=A0AC35TKA4_9BILA